MLRVDAIDPTVPVNSFSVRSEPALSNKDEMSLSVVVAYRINSSSPWEILQAFLSSADFSKSTFSKNSFRNTIRVSNNLGPDQARHFVGPDLGLGWLVLLLYVPSQQLWSLRDGQFT